MKWNEAQLSAIMTRNKNILVSAAAGSGKTAVLTERIKQLITKEGVGIDRMLIVTFTNAAAGEMRERIFKGITEAMEEEGADLIYLQSQLDGIESANISTFHAFCLEIIRNYFYLTDLTPDFRICDEAQKAILSKEAMEEVIEEFFDKKDEAFLDFVPKFSKAGNERGIISMIGGVYEFIRSLPDPLKWLDEKIGIIEHSEEEAERATYQDICVLRDMIVRFDEVFTRKKVESNLVDFGDVEHLALKILERPEPCSEYREKFLHIFIDEYQDTNAVQEELISRIKRENNLFMVGDVKQSIYQFRQADPEIFIDKYKLYKTGADENSIKIDLNRNFRSKTPVLESTNCVMSMVMTEEASGIGYDDAAMLYQGIDLSGTPYEDYYIEPTELHMIVGNDVKQNIVDFNDVKTPMGKDPVISIPENSTELEALFTCGRIKKLIGDVYYDSKTDEMKTIDYKDIVILMRANKADSPIYEEVFHKEGIPVYAEGGDGYFDTTEIGVFMNLLKVLTNRRQDIPLLSVLKSVIFGFSSNEIGTIRAAFKKGLFAEAFLRYADAGENMHLSEKCRKVLEKLDRWKNEARYMALKDFLWKLAEESGYYAFVQALPMGILRRENIKLLIRKGEGFQENSGQSLSGFVMYLEQLALSGEAIPGSKSVSDSDNVVRIMSVHKSKGLEFPVVFVNGLGKAFNHRKPSQELSMEKNLGIGLRYRSKGNEYYIKTERQLMIDQVVKDKEVAEEMRLLYVAMTRAKEKLILIGSIKKLEEGSYPGEKKTTSEKTNFMEWLWEAFISMRDERYYSAYEHRVYPWKDVLVLHNNAADIKSPETAKTTGWEDSEEVDNEDGVQLDFSSMIEALSDESSNLESHGTEKAVDEMDILTGAEAGGLSEAEKRIRERVFDSLDYSYGYNEATEIPAKFTATELNRLINAEKNRERELPEIKKALSKVSIVNGDGSKAKLTAAERGTLTHALLQEIDIYRTESMEDVISQIHELEEAGKLPENSSDEIHAEWIFRFFDSELGRRMKSSNKAYREKPFLLWNRFDEETGSLVQGIIDCFFEENDGLVLIDYKTDYIPNEEDEAFIQEKAEGYTTQLKIYKDALEKARGQKVKEAYLYFLSIGKAVKMEVRN